MILLFGPTGSGKSMQGKLLAARNGWRWLSAGQLLRDEKDSTLLEKMRLGELIEPETVNQVVKKALGRAGDIDKVVLDGYPRMLEQARFLLSSQKERTVKAVVVLDVSKQEILNRLTLRGRADDNIESIENRLNQYEKDMPVIYDYFVEENIPVIHIDGNDSVGKVHDKIMQALGELQLVTL